MRRLLLLALAALVVLAACGTDDPDEEGEAADDPVVVDEPEPADEPTATPTPTGDAGPDDAPVEVVVETAVTDLEVPWDLVWADGGAYVTERDAGTLRTVDLDSGDTEVVDTFDVDAAGEGGLLGLAVHPDDATTLYAYYSSAAHGDNRVVRFAPGEADDAEVIVDGIPHASIHNGGRLAFGPDGHLYITTGDANQQSRSQDPGSLGGAILRVTTEGEVPEANPFDTAVYATGIRNTQGLAWTADGDLVAAEFGPGENDEINVIQPGDNYGWPEVSGQAGVEPFVDPIFVRQPPEASWSGNEVLTDGAIPQWEGDAFVAALRGERLWHLELGGAGNESGGDGGNESGGDGGNESGGDGGNGSGGGPGVVDAHERLVGEFGRLRHVTQGPDGSLWLLTSNRDGRGNPIGVSDRVLRLGPAD